MCMSVEWIRKLSKCRRLRPAFAIVVALGLLAPTSAPAGPPTAEAGTRQLLERLNAGRCSPLKSEGLLTVMAESQAYANSRLKAAGELDELGQTLLDRCHVAGLTTSVYDVHEYYFRTLTPQGSNPIFGVMLDQVRDEHHEYVGLCCLEGEDGLFYWCITLGRIQESPALTARPASADPGWAPHCAIESVILLANRSRSTRTRSPSALLRSI